MSKHESRAKEIKIYFDQLGCTVSWAKRPSGLFVTVTNRPDSSKLQYSDFLNHIRKFYPKASLTSGGYGGGTFKIAEAEKPVIEGNMTFERVDCSVKLDMHRRTTDKERVDIRANAIFIQAKLCAAGLSPSEAKKAVEKLYNDGYGQGWNVGNDDGYQAGYDAADQYD